MHTYWHLVQIRPHGIRKLFEQESLQRPVASEELMERHARCALVAVSPPRTEGSTAESGEQHHGHVTDTPSVEQVSQCVGQSFFLHE